MVKHKYQAQLKNMKLKVKDNIITFIEKQGIVTIREGREKSALEVVYLETCGITGFQLSAECEIE